jgi:hypothetical protein
MGTDGNLETGLTRFLNAMYRCFRIISKFLICCQFCECKCKRKRARKSKSSQNERAEGATPDKNITGHQDNTDTSFAFPKRYVLAIMTFLGFMNMYALRVNLNVAIGAMVNNHTVDINGMQFLRVCRKHIEN